MQVTFFGVRGSTPCHGDNIARYGGNTSCVALHGDEGTVLTQIGLAPGQMEKV